MMAVGFPVCGDMHELSPGPRVRESTLQALRKLLAALQQLLKSHCLGDGAVVKKEIDPAARWQAGKVSARGINFPATDISPASSTEFAGPGCLTLGQNRE